MDWRGFWLRDEFDCPVSYNDLRLEPAGVEIFQVAGVSHREQALQQPCFSFGSEMKLIPEPKNPYDKNAIGVWDRSSQVQVGYVPKELAGAMGKRLAANDNLRCLCIAERLKDGRRVGLRLILGPKDLMQVRD